MASTWHSSVGIASKITSDESTKDIWDTQSASGRSSWRWDSDGSAGLVLGAFPSIGYCIKIKLSESRGLKRFGALSGGQGNSESTSTVSITEGLIMEHGVVLCAYACTSPHEPNFQGLKPPGGGDASNGKEDEDEDADTNPFFGKEKFDELRRAI